jgi:cell division protein ZapA (FtsZ GTPase activity inhibitor)
MHVFSIFFFIADVQKTYQNKYAGKVNETVSQISEEKAASVQAALKETKMIKEASRSLGWIAIMFLAGVFTLTILLDLSRLRNCCKVQKIMRNKKTPKDYKNEKQLGENIFEVYDNVREMDRQLQIKLEELSKRL